MDIPKIVKKLASDDGLPHVVPNGQWKEFELYVASDPEAPYIGPPQVILYSGDKARWATIEELDAIAEQ